jgi:sporulation protein YlmC with PRC-barrel domain
MFRKRRKSNGCLAAAAAGALLALGACGEGPPQPEVAPTAAMPDASASATAGTDRAPAPATSASAIDIINWDQAELRGGYSANRLIGMQVRGNGGNAIGEVEDVLVDASGKATAIVVESGGFFDIGDKHFRIPWDNAKLAADLEHVVVPISRETAAMYRDTRDRERVHTGPREYRMSELRNEVVTLAGGERYGAVDDLIIGRDGKVNAIVVEAATGQGRYAYPFRSQAYNPEANSYELPYQQTQINNLKPFNYRAASIAEPRARAIGATFTGAAEAAAGAERRERPTRPSREPRG